MEYIGYIILLLLCLILFKVIFKVNTKRVKLLEFNKEANQITDKFPDNLEIAKEMLKMLNNESVIVEENKDSKTSLYIVMTNKISIANMKSNYARIQTIAHECIHSCQNKDLLLFNFIFSNINIIYFVTILILTVFKLIENIPFQIFILTIFSLIWFSVRGYLEIDAMIKARYLSEKYLIKKQLCSLEKQEELLNKYDNINKIGIPFIVGSLLISCILKILFYVIISCIIV